MRIMRIMRTRCTYEEQLISGETIICGIEDAVVAHQSLKTRSQTPSKCATTPVIQKLRPQTKDGYAGV